MKVLHVIPSAAPEDGGPNEAVRAMARGLVAYGLDVTVATTNAAGRGSLDVPIGGSVLESGVVFRYFPRTVPGGWKFSWPLTRWLWRNAQAYDVVHVHALFSYATIPGCRAAARVPVPYVVRPLGTLSAWSLAHRAWKKRPYYALVERGHLAAASAIHVTSEAEADDVRQLGFGDRVWIIPLGVDVPPVRSPRARAVDAPLRLLYLSRLHPKKNLPVLLRALARAVAAGQAVELTIAGDGDARYQAHLASQAAELGLSDRVRFTGRVEGVAKQRLLDAADCFVLPSAHENFGIAVAEALAAGLPVIVSPGVALATQVGPARAGLVVAADERALADAITWCGAHPSELVLMGQRGRDLARTDLSWARTCTRLASLYDALVAPRRHADRPA